MNLRLTFPLRALFAVFGCLAFGLTQAVAQANLPNARVGESYSYQVSTTPPAPAGTVYSATGLPTGLGINSSSGRISGIPTTAGTFNGTISLTSNQVTNSFNVSILVQPPSGTPNITSSLTASGTVGAAFSYTATADNSPTSFNIGALPPGLTATGASISGTPTTAGTFSVPLSANNATGTGATRTLSLTIAAAGPVPAITSATSASTPVNAAFTYNIVASNGPIASYSALGLPFGLSLNASTGVISGTPTVAGVYTVALSATNVNGTSAVTNLTLTVGAVSAITSASTASFTQNQSGSFQLAASNTPLSFNVSGLPPGLSVNTATGVISGTPTSVGTFTVTASANNATGVGPAATLTLTVSAPPAGGGGGGAPTITSPIFTAQPASQSVIVGNSATFTAAAAGTGPLLYQWFKDGVAISGATSATLTLGNVQSADAGVYFVRVNNTAGSVFSTNARLTVAALITPPVITAQPAPQSVTAGGSVTFSVTATGTTPFTYQWFKNGTAIAGATLSTLTLANVSAADAGSYTVALANNAGASTSIPAVLSVTPATPPPSPVVLAPSIATQPASRTAGVGATVTLGVAASGTDVAYQWHRNGVPIPGATSATLTLVNVPASATGNYAVTVTNALGSVTSTAAVLVVLPTNAQVINLSTRGLVGTGERVLIAGFVILGDAPKPVLIRAIGPSLTAFGVPGAVADPTLELFNSASVRIATNDNWGTATNATAIVTTAARVGAFTLNASSSDSAILTTLEPGAYTAVVSGVANTTGTGLVEIYDTSESPTPSRLINVATRGDVGTGGNPLIAGFVISGPDPKRVLVRAAGPALAAFGLPGAISDPRLQLYRDGAVVHENDNWGSAGDAAQIAAAARAVGAFGFPDDSRDAAVLVTLPPGTYSAVVSGTGAATGTALVEVYEVP